MNTQKKNTLHELLAANLKWIFVGGKGGVGKTTTSSAISVLFAQSGKKTLIVSTDPAHNLSDCFKEKIGNNPTKVPLIQNLWAMEIDPKSNIESQQLQLPFLKKEQGDGAKVIIKELISSAPGIDQAISFSTLISSIEKLKFDTIVFDTAPTGHTLRFLNFPNIIEKGMQQLLNFKTKFGSLFKPLQMMFSSQQQFGSNIQKIFKGIENMKQVASKVNQQMKDPNLTQFVAVCIPQFLSFYQTDRLVEQLSKFQIEITTIVVNQVIQPCSQCKLCNARAKMQDKYLKQIFQLYDLFNVVIQYLQQDEVTGVQKLKKFGNGLLIQKRGPLM